MKIFDARQDGESLDIDTHGFCVANLKTSLPETLELLLEEKEANIREIYWPEIIELVRRTIGRDVDYTHDLFRL